MSNGVRRVVPVLLLLTLAFGACGGSESSDPEPATTVMTEPQNLTPSTTSYLQNPCFGFPTRVLRLQNDYRMDVRGIAGADEAAYRRRAQAILDEARSLGCPDPRGLNMFLQ